MSEEPNTAASSSASRAGIGTAIGLYALLDTPIGFGLLLLAAWGRALVVYVVAVVVLAVINLASCNWIQREWDRWMTGERTAKYEAKLQKMREGRMRRVVTGITEGSVGWYLLGAVLTNAIMAITFARALGGKPVPARKVTVTALFFAIFFPAVFCLAGWAAGDVIRSA